MMDTTEPVQTQQEPADQVQEEQRENKPIDKARLFNDVMDILETMLLSVFVILLLFTYLIRPVTVDGSSMVPTLRNGDRLVMFRLFYQPTYGDVVVVDNHDSHLLDAYGNVIENERSLNECLIKRVIATEGQTLNIDFESGSLYVDGVLLEEPYINDLTHYNDGAFTYPITIPEGYVFVMGDNRNHSTDSRSSAVGLVDKADVLGRAFFRYHAARDELTGEKVSSVGFIH